MAMSDSQRHRAPSVEDMAEYLADLIGQLSKLASDSGFGTVAYALEVAQLAAQEEATGRADRGSSKPRPQLHS